MPTTPRLSSGETSRVEYGEADSRGSPLRDRSRSVADASSTSTNEQKSSVASSKSAVVPLMTADASARQQRQAQNAVAPPVMLANPLSMQATVLRIPDFFVNTLPSGQDLVEEGDILYDVLKDPRFESEESDNAAGNGEEAECRKASRLLPSSGWASPVAGIGVQPVLTLPDKVGKYLAHEHLKALICFINGAVYPLFNLHFRVDVVLPPGAVPAGTPLTASPSFPPPSSGNRRSLFQKKNPLMQPKSSTDHIVDVPLLVAGTYVLDVNVQYFDPSGEERRLTWASSFAVEQAITEVSRLLLRRVPLAVEGRNTAKNNAALSAKGYDLEKRPAGPPTQADALRNLRIPLHRYLLTASLKNTCSVPLTLCRVALVAASSTDAEPTDGRGGPSPLKLLQSTNVASVGEGAGQRGSHEGPTDIFLQPGEQHQYSVEFLLLTDALQTSLVVHSTATGAVSALLKSPLNGPLGWMEWEWRRWNGDGGRQRSRPILLEQLVGLPAMEVVVVCVRPAAMPCVEHAEVPDEEPLRAGHPVELELCLVHYGKCNHSNDEAPAEVSLKVRPEKLAPYWLYTGAIPRPLGHVAPHSTLYFKLTLLPWRSGWVPLPRDSLEIVDTRSPERILAPLPPVVIKSTSIAMTSSARKENGKQGGILPGTVIAPSLKQKKGPQTAVVTAISTDHEANGDAVGLCVEGDLSDSVLCEVLVL